MELHTNPSKNITLEGQKNTCRIQIGTSGYSYAEWVTAGFYPPGTGSSHMLTCYAQTFGTTELNYTWYQMPKAPAMERMMQKVPPDFRFAVKLTRTMTHEVEGTQWRGQVAQYKDGVAPLIQSKQLATILVQLPPYFNRTLENRRYLADLLDELADLPLAVEFRHASWAAQRVFDSLTERKVALVAVDEPSLPTLFPSLDVVTHSDFFYLRFHGRNAKGWRSGNMQQQFDYDYSDAELREWTNERLLQMASQAENGLIFFNNHVRAQAPKNAHRLMQLLGKH